VERLPAGEFCRFAFYKVRRDWKEIDPSARRGYVDGFQKALEGFTEQVWTRSYTTQGFRGDADFLLWSVTRELPLLEQLAGAIAKTDLAYHLDTSYHYLSMTRESIYLKGHGHGTNAEDTKTGEWLFIYPFVKTREWYKLPFEVRHKMMGEHFKIGHQFPNVKINTTYSYGLDDQEFVLAFETDSPRDFQALVIKLRDSEASSYTLRDTPIFTCLQRPLGEILASLL